MSLTLLQNATFMGFGISQTLSVSGGVAPYTWSVQAGGAGGSINSSTGKYTAPQFTNPDTIMQDTIIVTDSTSPTPLTASTLVTIGSPLEIVLDIIRTYMGLAQNRVFLWDQKIFEPTDFGLFVVGGISGHKIIGNNILNNGDGTVFQYTNVMATLDLNIISRGNAALYQKEQVLLALRSVYSEQQQELNCLKIFPVPVAFTNVSGIDGSAIPYRFVLSVRLQYSILNNESVPYFSTFPTTSIDYVQP